MFNFNKILESLLAKGTSPRSKTTLLQLESFEDRQVPALLTIGGSVYDDKNGNGIRDGSETGLSGVGMELRNSQGILVSTSTCASDGSYRFDRYSALPVQSLTKKFDTTISPSKSNFTGVVSLPGFDSSLGALDSVELILTSTGNTNLKVENLEDGQETISLQPAGTFRAAVPGLTPVEIQSNPPPSILNLGPSDGINDFSGSSGSTLPPVSLNGSKTMMYTANDGLSMFANPLVSLNVSSRVVIRSETPGNVMVQANSMVSLNVAVVYHYRAVPPLDPGNYTITQSSQPPGYVDGLLTTNNIAPIPGSIGVNSVNVTLNQTPITQVNFGEVKPSLVSGMVRQLPDGITQLASTGISGAVVSLQGTNDLGQNVSVDQLTGPDGTFSFSNLRPGTYQISANAGKRIMADSQAGSAGGIATPSQITQIKLVSGTVGTSYIFNTIVPSTLVGTSFQDNNSNGIFDAPDSLLSNVTVTLTGSDYKGRPVSFTSFTDSFGEYSFASILPGTYSVKAQAPSGLLVGPVKAGTLGGTVGTDGVSNIKVGQDAYGDNYDFPFVNPARVSGFVFNDQNNDGLRKSQAAASSLSVDPGIGSVQVILTGMDINSTLVNLTTRTLADGSYDFGNLKPGNYKIQAIIPAGYLEGKTSAGTSGSASARASTISGLSLSAGQTASEYNFGLLKPTVISGVVANDIAANNRYDAGDTGIAGVLVYLSGTDSFGKAVSLVTTTNAGGAYSFGSISPGNYTLRMGTTPTGYTGPVVQTGSVGGALNGQAVNLSLNQGMNGTGYNFLLKAVTRSKRGFFN